MSAHPYGPPRLPDPWPTVTVFRSTADGGDVEAPQPRAIVEQRRQINARAYLAALEERDQ